MISLETILLLLIYVALLFPALISNDWSPLNVFKTSGSYLGSRIEKDLTIGRDFTPQGGEGWKWLEKE